VGLQLGQVDLDELVVLGSFIGLEMLPEEYGSRRGLRARRR